MLALLRTLRHPVLFHEHKRRKHNRFDGHYHRQQDEWIGIELRQPEEVSCVDEEPDGKRHNVQQHKIYAATEAGDSVGYAVQPSALVEEFLLKACDGFDVPLGRTCNTRRLALRQDAVPE